MDVRSGSAEMRSCPLRDPSLGEEAARIRVQIRRGLLVVAGSFFVGLGVIGIFVPILPTTCFLILAAACYARSSQRLYDWLHENRVFGSYLKGYRDRRAVPRRIKLASIAILWGTIAVSFALVPLLWVRILLVAVALAVTLHVGSLATVERLDA